jgi:hypothetical protein
VTVWQGRRVGFSATLRDDVHGPLDRNANQRLARISPRISRQLPALGCEQILPLFGLMGLNARRRELFGRWKRAVRNPPVVDGIQCPDRTEHESERCEGRPQYRTGGDSWRLELRGGGLGVMCHGALPRE